ncbi:MULTISPECIES: carbohydrate ABC transporter permease [Rathayibacter]|uniref:carbohydrate ABC transporter permease n=1 Tax=Rathayibacter TaxID=33886 RepID=UPI000FC2831D|nr:MULTISPECIES: sugar ABC transporter permease [Rathayibacter]MCJ1683098.1 sugar ABC transporter permease [Rathayibacter sp. VKM Ac-2928]MCJ1687975.1 sugar ABC transporter permease [Rathayibacter sp. VKM Ac-2927]MCJ1698570.1 sugar ABC transporter permease [Rathayibacter festucae]ROQ03860.1 multiple sugar transport system permease protein/raffinose/stachyose/melibiose transport system permease protein [Rathayibacter sp. PhB93]TDQ10886.1 multiple sugar transport system permease protein/raffinos
MTTTALREDARPEAPAAKRRRRGLGWSGRLEVAILVGPALIVFLAFVIFPVVMAAYYGFFSWQGYGVPTDFVGFKNYLTILQDPTFHEALSHNGTIVVLSLVLQGPAAILIALLLNRKLRGQSIIRVLIFVPYVISEVVVGTGWSLMLQTSGAVNGFLEKVGLGALKQDWLSDPAIAIWTLMLIITWKYIGFAVILFLAGLQGIPEELSEAASIDGASYWQVQRRITLPLLAPTLRIWAFLSIIGALQLFDLVYIIWGQYVSSTAGTSTMATYLVTNGRNAGNYGYGNAVAVVLFLVSLIVALLYQRFVLRRDTEGALTGDTRKAGAKR